MPSEETIKSVFFQSDKSRRQILLSYWIVVLLSVPLWWITTSITRLPLPESRVSEIQSKKLRVPLHLTFDDSLSPYASGILENLNEHVHNLGLDEAVFFTSTKEYNEAAYTIVLDNDASEIVIKGRRMIVGAKSLPKAERQKEIAETIKNLLLTGFIPSQQTAQFSSRYRLAFSLMNEDSTAGPSPLTWDIGNSINQEIKPVLQRLSLLHNFTIESQVQYYAPLAFEPNKLEDEGWGLTQEQLSVFVNSAEWTLSSSVSNDPVLHFIIFIPSASRRPLRILSSEGLPVSSTAFSIPQWGSIFIYNPPNDTDTTHLSSHSLHSAFSIFRSQLLSLLGVPSLPPNVRVQPSSPSSPSTLAELIVPDWSLDTILRRRAYENAQESKHTLGSIVNLVNQIEGMPVEKDVTDDVDKALNALDNLHKTLSTSPLLAFQHSAQAFTAASRAFFNPGMLALLYFPPEHNLAVYTPLLAPVAVPLIAAVLREIKRSRNKGAGEGKVPAEGVRGAI